MGELGGVPTCVKIVMVFLSNVIIPKLENTPQKDAPGRKTFREILQAGEMGIPVQYLEPYDYIQIALEPHTSMSVLKRLSVEEEKLTLF
jgi:hypothetical protein